MGYSGQCYLSAAIGGRSGNRGRCAQPCRQSYGYNRWENKYPLSLKDNCLVEYLQELEEMGVTSIKLEGRMKRAEYVAAVTSVYRKALKDSVVTKPMVKQLYKAFNRQGFTDGYYQGKTGPEMFGIREDTAEDQEWLKEIRNTYENMENGLVQLLFTAVVTSQACYLTVTDPEGRSCTAYGPQPEIARNQPLTAEMLSQRLCKTGGTPYRCMQVAATVEPGLIISAAAINAMRRDALNQLTALRGRREPVRLQRPMKLPRYAGNPNRPELTVQVTTREQVTERLLRMAPKVLYVPLHLLVEDTAWCRELTRRVNVSVVLPRILHDGELVRVKEQLTMLRSLGISDALVGNLGMLLPVRQAGLQIRGDFGLNLYNSGAVHMARELEFRSATLSFEMTLPQIRDVGKAVPCEILIYGRMPLMVTENCLIRGKTGQCTCHLAPTKLVDKTGAEFPVIRDGSNCRSILLNGK